MRPWCGNKRAVGLRATFGPAHGPGLDIDLGRAGFSLNINYELADPMTPDEPESLSVGVFRYESDTDAELFVPLFGKLARYKRPIRNIRIEGIDNIGGRGRPSDGYFCTELAITIDETGDGVVNQVAAKSANKLSIAVSTAERIGVT